MLGDAERQEQVTAGLLKPITVTVENYEVTPGVYRSGVFVMRLPTLADEAAIETKAVQIAAPARLADMDSIGQDFMRACAEIMVLGAADPSGKGAAGSVPPWYSTSSPEIRRDLVIRVATAFLEGRQRMFHHPEPEGEGAVKRPVLAVTASVGE